MVLISEPATKNIYACGEVGNDDCQSLCCFESGSKIQKMDVNSTSEMNITRTFWILPSEKKLEAMMIIDDDNNQVLQRDGSQNPEPGGHSDNPMV